MCAVKITLIRCHQFEFLFSCWQQKYVKVSQCPIEVIKYAWLVQSEFIEPLTYCFSLLFFAFHRFFLVNKTFKVSRRFKTLFITFCVNTKARNLVCYGCTQFSVCMLAFIVVAKIMNIFRAIWRKFCWLTWLYFVTFYNTKIYDVVLIYHT